MGGATALLSTCDKDPVENLVPLLVPPDDYLPGKSIYFATTCQECPANCGMMIRTREGRAVKAEGNPHHPFNRGALCATGQAALQGLYNPARIHGPFKRLNGVRHDITWNQGLQILVDQISDPGRKTSGRRILYLGRPDSGSASNLLDQWLAGIGGAERLVLDLNPMNALATAGERVFGKREWPQFRFDAAETVVNIGADFRECGLNPVESMSGSGSYHYTFIGPRLSVSGINADEQLICHPGTELSICLALARVLTSRSKRITESQRSALNHMLAPYAPRAVAAETGVNLPFLLRTADRIGLNGNSLVLGGGMTTAGRHQTALQVALLLINYLAGNIGETVIYGTETGYRRHDLARFSEAIEIMNQGQVDLVVMDNVNPLYALPQRAAIGDALAKVPFIVSFSTTADESTPLADLHLPVSHPLESWGDAHPRRGVYSLQQPVMSPVPGFRTRARGDLLLSLGKRLQLPGFEAPTFHDHLQRRWQSLHRNSGDTSGFSEFWNRCLQRGGFFQDFKPSVPTLQPFWDHFRFPDPDKRPELTLLCLSSVLHDINGYSGDKYWLHETPDPVSQVVWDSWLEIHPDTAHRLGIENGERVEISDSSGNTVQVGAWLYPGIARSAIGLPVGLGRSLSFPDYTHFKRDLIVPTRPRDPRRMKTVRPGINPVQLMPFEWDLYSGDPVLMTDEIQIKALQRASELVTVDGHYGLGEKTGQKTPDRSQRGRGLVRGVKRKTGDKEMTVESQLPTEHHGQGLYGEMKDVVRSHPLHLQGLDTPDYHDPYRWEMVVDLDRCTGCSACVVACYAENNIAVVGKERQAVGREMPWLRIERYFKVDPDTGKLELDVMPQMCAQCENAGCEPVCPLYATYHNPDGLNTMIYARCAGTRYCANNCIYKSRRFNWRTYVFPPPLHLQLNPDVTVRDKGVMEKCTFCIQRIKEAKEIARLENRTVRDGEFETACQQSCPAKAITFGNGQDSNSRVARLKEKRRAYRLLEEYNYKPAVTYLKQIKHT